MTSSITLQRCANGVICIPTTAGNPPDLSLAYIFGDITSVTSVGTAALLAFINQSLGSPLPTVGEIRADLQSASDTLTPGETPLP
jgi:hypothetical protein